MKPHAFSIRVESLPHGPHRVNRAAWLSANPAGWLTAILVSALPAAALTVLAAWAFGSEASHVAAAVLWTAGFLFFALAIERTGPPAVWLGFSALVLMTLAILGFAVTPEFGMLGGFLLAGWTAAAIYARLPSKSKA